MSAKQLFDLVEPMARLFRLPQRLRRLFQGAACVGQGLRNVIPKLPQFVVIHD